jgi:PKHD-type hydroxylase
MIAALISDHPQTMKTVGMARLIVQDPAIASFGLIELAGAMGLSRLGKKRLDIRIGLGGFAPVLPIHNAADKPSARRLQKETAHSQALRQLRERNTIGPQMAGGEPQTPVLMEGGSVTWRGLFETGVLNALEGYCDRLLLEPARLNSGMHDIRMTQVAWLHRGPETEALYRQVEAIVLRLNTDLFHFDLSGLTTMQYAVYRASDGSYFDWHNDYGRARDDPGQEPRKITLSLQLSDGASYDGCDLEIRAAHPIDIAPRERGALVAFRANALHRVTPIARGVRKCLVAWAAGPEFR